MRHCANTWLLTLSSEPAPLSQTQIEVRKKSGDHEHRYLFITVMVPMTRKRVTASEKKQRHEWAVRQIDTGMGLSELTAFTAETWGCSRRNARDVVAAAHKDWLDACYGSEEIDQRDLLFQQVDA